MKAKELEGKVSIVTGGVSGIGRATVELFVEEGAKVVIADVSEDAGYALASDLGSTVQFKRTDVSKSSDVEAVVAFAVSKFGCLDIMFNNAGISENLKKTEFIDERFSDFEKVLSVDLLGPMLGTKFAARQMKAQRSGSIINTASTAGFYPGHGIPVYRAAKAGVIALTQMAAVELGKLGIRVNCISPGPIETPMAGGGQVSEVLANELMRATSRLLTDMQLLERTGKPEDVANAALFLASARAANITGHNLVVDGGSSVGDKIDRTTLLTEEFTRIYARHEK